MRTIGFILIGAVIGIVLMIIVSVIAISGKMSDEEYRREIENISSIGKDDEDK